MRGQMITNPTTKERDMALTKRTVACDRKFFKDSFCGSRLWIRDIEYNSDTDKLENVWTCPNCGNQKPRQTRTSARQARLESILQSIA